MESLRKNVLLTGLPRSGKSTLLARLIKEQRNAVGFLTAEILAGGGRLGFQIMTHNGTQATLAHINSPSPVMVGKYHVDTAALESIIPMVSTFTPNDLLYIDEIGEMQLHSENFKDLVLKYLEAPAICIATISAVYENAFIDALKGRSDVSVIYLSPENRELEYLRIKEFLAAHSNQKLPRVEELS